MADAVPIKGGLFGEGGLGHFELPGREPFELLKGRRFERRFGLALFRAVDVYLRLRNWHPPPRDEPLGDFELLIHDVADANRVGLLDERAHLGSEDAL